MLVCVGWCTGSVSVWVPKFRSSVLVSSSRTYERRRWENTLFRKVRIHTLTDTEVPLRKFELRKTLMLKKKKWYLKVKMNLRTAEFEGRNLTGIISIIIPKRNWSFTVLLPDWVLQIKILLSRKKLVICYIWLRAIAFYGAEIWTLRAVDQKHLGKFEMWCWRRIEKIMILNFRRVLIVVPFLLGKSPASVY